MELKLTEAEKAELANLKQSINTAETTLRGLREKVVDLEVAAAGRTVKKGDIVKSFHGVARSYRPGEPKHRGPARTFTVYSVYMRWGQISVRAVPTRKDGTPGDLVDLGSGWHLPETDSGALS